MSKKPRGSGTDGTPPMIAVEGQVRMLDGFFEHLDERIGIAVREAVASAMSEVKLPTASVQAGGGAARVERDDGVELAADERKAARGARQTLESKLGLDDGQGMIDTKSFARFLAVSPRALYSLMAEGALPKPVSLAGRIRRWSIEEVLAWVMEGCPREEHWKRSRVLALRKYRDLVLSKK